MNKVPPYIFNERDERLLLQYLLLTRQITALSDCFQHIIRLGNKPDNKINRDKFLAYKLFSQTELSDIIMQVYKLCGLLDISISETIKMGMDRQEEKKEAYLKRYPDDVWI